MGRIALPTTSGWMVDWYTGKTVVTKKGETLRFKDSYESTSKEKVEAKAEELKRNGFEVIGIYECIF